MVNVKVIVAENRQILRDKFENGYWPEMVAVPYGVFLKKVQVNHLNVYIVDLTAAKQRKQHVKARVAGIIFEEEIATSCSRWEILPGKTYLLLSEEAGYTPELGLTFEGNGQETGWKPFNNKGERLHQFGGKKQTFQEHSEGVYQRAKQIVEQYRPFLVAWAQGIFGIDNRKSEEIVQNLTTAIVTASLFHDIGKLSKIWQKAVWEKVIEKT